MRHEDLAEWAFLGWVSIHAPVKGATKDVEQAGECEIVSIHAPVKGATRFARELEERRRVSIHAPVKGATLDKRGNVKAKQVSIHAPVKGATDEAVDKLIEITGFNPRTREGCDERDRFS